MEKACNNVGLSYSTLKNLTKQNEPELIKQIERNQEEQQVAGHHGVPLLVYKENVFFGQDNFDACKQLLIEDGLLEV
jgi:2-hydroxychromene-2-carboxylate isomerase